MPSTVIQGESLAPNPVSTVLPLFSIRTYIDFSVFYIHTDFYMKFAHEQWKHFESIPNKEQNQGLSESKEIWKTGELTFV